MDTDGYYMVDGMNTWKLVKAVQEQQQIEELKQENQELMKRIGNLEAQK